MKRIKICNKILSLLLSFILILGSVGTQIKTYANSVETISSISLPIEGSASGKGTPNVIYKGFSADASKVIDPYLKISIYIAKNEDITADVSELLGKRQIELTSSGTYDKEEIHWDMTKFTLNTGWNTLYLPFSEAEAQDDSVNKFDISAINYFRFYNQHSAKNIEFTLKVKNVSIISGVDLPVNLPIDGSVSGKGTPQIIKNNFLVDASNIENPYLKISIYIAKNEDITADVSELLGKRQIELTSSGTYDKEEIHWDMTKFTLNTGWNTLYLPFSEAEAQDDGVNKFDITAINYFRFYNQHSPKNIEFTLKVKDASIISGSNVPINLPVEGSSSGSGQRVITYKNFSVDASNVTDPYLKLSVYIAKNDDTAADISDLLKSSGIELTSSGKYDVAEIAWSNATVNLEAGWNTIYLPFSDGKYTDGGSSFDISSINYFRIYHNPIDNSIEFTLKIKNVSIVSGNDISDSEESNIPNDLIFAKLDGTERNICHPGLSGEFNSGDYEGKHFDRRLSFEPSGDIKDRAYVMRTAVSGMTALDISEYNVFTFDLLVEDNGAWEDYRNNLTFSIMKNSNTYYEVSDNSLKNALKNVVPGVKSKITISLSSIGQKKLRDVAGFMISLKDGTSDKILHLTITNAVVKFNADYPTVIYDISKADIQVSQKVFLIDELGIRGTLGASADDTYQNVSSKFVRDAIIDDCVFNGDISETEFISFQIYISKLTALPSDMFIAFGYSESQGIKYLNSIDVRSQITQDGWNTVIIKTENIGAKEKLTDISSWKLFTNDTSKLAENYKVIIHACNFTGVMLDIVPTLTVGNDETEMYVTWFTTSDKLGSVIISDGVSESKIEAYEQGESTADFYYYNRAKISGLKANTDYTYKVGTEDFWSEEYALRTSDFDNSFSFIHISDVQLNGSQTQVDNWNKTLMAINRNFPNTNFILDTGDVSDIYYRNDLYMLYKSPQLLKNYITAVVPGNHDKIKVSGDSLFTQHFTISENKEVYTGYGVNECDYWYSYNNVLFISLNSNITDNDYHEAFVRKVVSEQGNKYDWKIVTTHISAFGASYHSQENETINFREQLAPVFSELKVDAVLSGHDHCYDRSYIMNGVTPIINDGIYAANTDGGVLYISGSTASSSKYNSPVNGCEEYSAKIIQNKFGFVNCEVAAGRLIFTFYNSENMEILDKFTLYKDGQISSADLVVLRKGLLFDTAKEDLYDYNYDGEINIIDLIRLKKKLVNVA